MEGELLVGRVEEDQEQLNISSSECSSSEYSKEATHERYAQASVNTEDGDTEQQGHSQTSHSLLLTRLSASAEPSRYYSNIRDRADLLCAQGRIVQLETMVESMERATKRARVQEEIEEEGTEAREAAKLHKVLLPLHSLRILYSAHA